MKKTEVAIQDNLLVQLSFLLCRGAKLNFHLPRQLQSTMLPASPHSASLHMKIYPACNGSVIIVDYTSTSMYWKLCKTLKAHFEKKENFT